MYEIAVCKAEAATVEVEDTIIRIDRKLNLELGWDEVTQFENDAEALVAALKKHLPGGTLRRVTAKLLVHYAEILRVTD